MVAIPFVRTVIHWSGAGEEGQFGFIIAGTDGTPQADLEEYVGNFVNLFVGDQSLTDLRGLLSVDQAVDKVLAYGYDTSETVATASAVGDIAHADGVGVGGNFLPLQSAVCVTLETGHSGASFRGRCYLPYTGLNLSTNHQIASSEVDTIAGIFVGGSDYTGILGIAQDAWASVGSHSTPNAAVFSPKLHITTAITAVKVDSVPDTQRRRRDRETPAYVKTAAFV